MLIEEVQIHQPATCRLLVAVIAVHCNGLEAKALGRNVLALPVKVVEGQHRGAAGVIVGVVMSDCSVENWDGTRMTVPADQVLQCSAKEVVSLQQVESNRPTQSTDGGDQGCVKIISGRCAGRVGEIVKDNKVIINHGGLQVNGCPFEIMDWRGEKIGRDNEICTKDVRFIGRSAMVRLQRDEDGRPSIGSCVEVVDKTSGNKGRFGVIVDDAELSGSNAHLVAEDSPTDRCTFAIEDGMAPYSAINRASCQGHHHPKKKHVGCRSSSRS